MIIYKWSSNLNGDLKHLAVDHIVKKQHLSCSLFKILPRAVHCPQKNKISCQSLVFRGDSSFQPCDSYPPPSTGCQSRVCPSYLCLFFIQNIPESEKCLFRRKFLIGQEPYFLVKLKLWCISAHFDQKSRFKVFRVKSFTHSLSKLMSQNLMAQEGWWMWSRHGKFSRCDSLFIFLLALRPKFWSSTYCCCACASFCDACQTLLAPMSKLLYVKTKGSAISLPLHGSTNSTLWKKHALYTEFW